MLHKAEIWGYVEISPGCRVENLRDDGSVRTDYYTEEQLKLLVSTAVETRGRAATIYTAMRFTFFETTHWPPIPGSNDDASSH